MTIREVAVTLSANIKEGDAESMSRITESFSRVMLGLALEGISVHVSVNTFDLDSDPTGED